ncbi:hypothetical protein JCM8547_005958 [Rhodosporidiobolus lusitaniae]
MLVVYVEDFSDVESVETVYRICVEQCGFVPNSFKNLLGVTSRHPSKLHVSMYTSRSFTTKEEVEETIEAYKKRGPASSISPLSGPPAAPEIDFSNTFTAPNDQPSYPSGSFSSSSPAKKKGKAGKKKKDESSDDGDFKDVVPVETTRTPRKAAVKGRKILRQAAE